MNCPRTLILANGAFPRKGTLPYRFLREAGRIVACDGAADQLRRHLGRIADFTVGDLDSISSRAHSGELVHVADQETNDLAKAINFCRARGWKDLAIVGAMGRRDDHSLGNVFRAMEAGVPIITEFGVFRPFGPGECRIRTFPGMPISVFATDRRTRMKSTGLEWPLDGVRFENLYCATLNRAIGRRVVIESNFAAFVFKGGAGA